MMSIFVYVNTIDSRANYKAHDHIFTLSIYVCPEPR